MDHQVGISVYFRSVVRIVLAILVIFLGQNLPELCCRTTEIFPGIR
jgi:hypothetical protein